MTKTLDKSRPFGSVHPADDGQHYEQDGYPFDHDGKLCLHKLTKAQKDKLGAAAKPTPPKPAQNTSPANETLPAIEAKDGGDGDSGTTTAAVVSDDGTLNLEAWLKTGLKSAPIKDVQNAVKERYSKWCTKPSDLVEFLVDGQKLVAKDDCAEDVQALLG